MPAHRIYVEPFGGGASVLLRKPRTYGEVYNDLDADIVGLFRVLRDPAQAERLRQLLLLTPYARDELDAAYEPDPDPVEAARRLVVRSFMGFGSTGFNVEKRTGFRSNVTRSGSTPAMDWTRWPAGIGAYVTRLHGVTIENADALDVMRRHDTAATLHYVDPPYVHATRGQEGLQVKHTYRHEMDDAAHGALLEVLKDLKGMAMVSGYSTPLYEERLAGWARHEFEALADGARKRLEVLWLSPSCAQALADLGPLFDGEE